MSEANTEPERTGRVPTAEASAVVAGPRPVTGEAPPTEPPTRPP
jgi:hypothetical protein